jgi:hypothetical protein
MKKLDEMLEAIQHVHTKVGDLEEGELNALLQWVRRKMVYEQALSADTSRSSRDRFRARVMADFYLAIADLVAMEPPFMEERQ